MWALRFSKGLWTQGGGFGMAWAFDGLREGFDDRPKWL